MKGEVLFLNLKEALVDLRKFLNTPITDIGSFNKKFGGAFKMNKSELKELRKDLEFEGRISIINGRIEVND